MKQGLLFGGIILLLSQAAQGMDFGTRFWNQELGGGLGATSSGISGSADIVEDGQRESSFFFRGMMFDLEYTPLNNGNVLNGTGTFDFAGETFQFDQNARLDAKIGMFDVFFRKRIFSGVGQTFHLLLGAKIAQTEFIVSADDPLSPGTRLVERVDETIPIPQIGIATSHKLGPKLRFNGLFKWLDVNIQDVEVKVTDLQYGVGWVTATGFSLDVGYRQFKMEAAYDQGSAEAAYVNLDYSGPYIGATYRF